MQPTPIIIKPIGSPTATAGASVASCERDDRPTYTLAYLEAIDAPTSPQKLRYGIIPTLFPTILPTKLKSIAKSNYRQPHISNLSQLEQLWEVSGGGPPQKTYLVITNAIALTRIALLKMSGPKYIYTW